MIRTLRDAFGANRLMWATDCPYQVQDGHTYADSDSAAYAACHPKHVSDERRLAYRYRLYAGREIIDYYQGRAIARLPERKSADHAGAHPEQR